MSEKKEHMTVRSEDPVQYSCGNARAPHTRLMEYDGSITTVLTWRPGGKIEGDSMVWRFITTEGRAVAVRPVQLPSNQRPFCVPAEINSAMREASWLIRLAHDRVSVSGVAPDAPDKADRIKEITLYEINTFIGRATGKKPVAVSKPRKGGYTAKQLAVIVKRLTDPKDKGAAQLEAIRTFILHKLFKSPGLEITEALTKKLDSAAKTYPPPGGFAGSIIRDMNLRRLVQFMGEQIGRKDMPLRVLLTYNSAMPEMFKGWVAETAKARKMKPADAELFLAERVTFIAECEGRRFRHCYPIEDLTEEADVMNQEDRAPYQTSVWKESETIDPPLVAHGRYENKGRPGRPIETDPKRDAALLKQYKTMKAAGDAPTHADFAESIGKPLREVKPALERARKSQERLRVARQI